MLRLRKYPTGAAVAVMLLYALGTSLLTTARLPFLEQSVCRSYYLAHDPTIIDKDGSVPEIRCKVTEIQTELARLVGWAGFFIEFPGTSRVNS